MFDERVEAEKGDDFGFMGAGREDKIAFPLAERNRAYAQNSGCLGLVDSEFKATAAKMATDGGWLLGNRNSTVVRGEVFAPRHAHNPVTIWQHRAQVSLPICEFFGRW